MRPCDRASWTCAYVLGALPAHEVPEIEAHIASCAQCAAAVAALRPLSLTDEAGLSEVPSPPQSLQLRLAERIAADLGSAMVPPPPPQWREPEWEEVAPGISCKLLANDAQTAIVSMLVRLAPNTEYPPHTHAGIEELHLLEGELWINDRKLHPGDYSRAEQDTTDTRVWSETGCTCVLITSTRDVLR